MITPITDFNVALINLAARDACSAMLLFAAYIDDYLCYELYCERIPYENFVVLRDEFKTNTKMRTALKESSAIERALKSYIRSALEDFDMFYHFLDGISTILSDAELTCMIPYRDRNLTHDLFNAWKEGTLDRSTWDTHLENFGKFA